MRIACIVGHDHRRTRFLNFGSHRRVEPHPKYVTPSRRSSRLRSIGLLGSGHSGQSSPSVTLQTSPSVPRHDSLDAARYAASSSARVGRSLARTASSINALMRFRGSSCLSRAYKASSIVMLRCAAISCSLCRIRRFVKAPRTMTRNRRALGSRRARRALPIETRTGTVMIAMSGFELCANVAWLASCHGHSFGAHHAHKSVHSTGGAPVRALMRPSCRGSPPAEWALSRSPPARRAE